MYMYKPIVVCVVLAIMCAFPAPVHGVVCYLHWEGTGYSDYDRQWHVLDNWARSYPKMDYPLRLPTWEDHVEIDDRADTVPILGSNPNGTRWGCASLCVRNAGMEHRGYLDVGTGIRVGGSTGPNSLYILTSGELIVAGGIDLCASQGTSTTFSQRGGAVHVNGAAGLQINTYGTTDTDKEVKYEIYGPSTLTVVADLVVGHTGRGQFSQRAGNVAVGGAMKVGGTAPTSIAICSLEGGSITASSVTVGVPVGTDEETATVQVSGTAQLCSSSSIAVGQEGKGTITQVGGSVTADGSLWIGGDLAASDGTYTLSGGTVGAATIVIGGVDGSGVLVIDGDAGAVEATADSTTAPDIQVNSTGAVQYFVHDAADDCVTPLRAKGEITLGGTLDIVIDAPVPGRDLLLVQADSDLDANGVLTGAFASVAMQDHTITEDGKDFPLRWLLTYTTTELRARETYVGDANLDNRVDDADLNILLAHWAMMTGATWADGDFNGDGAVNDSDLNILLSNWGAGVSGEEAASMALQDFNENGVMDAEDVEILADRLAEEAAAE